MRSYDDTTQATPLATLAGVYSELRACGELRFVCLFESHSTPIQLCLFSLGEAGTAVKRVIASAGLVMPPEISAMCIAPQEIRFVHIVS